MRVKLSRIIHAHPTDSGFKSETITKEIEGVAPVLGAELSDSAWHRNDTVKIESIIIDTNEPDQYYVELTSKELTTYEQIHSYVEMAKLHGWES
ncbi:hypothetical protein R4796_01050 [Acinetobacter baumannii]|nr:hypothetical protein [Acinetobacter baumannii]